MDKLIALEREKKRIEEEIVREKKAQKAKVVMSVAAQIIRFEITLEELTSAIELTQVGVRSDTAVPAREARKSTDRVAPKKSAEVPGKVSQGRTTVAAKSLAGATDDHGVGNEAEGDAVEGAAIAKRRPGRRPMAKALVSPKYRDPVSGKTWSGRGLQPTWFREALSAGKTPADLAIRSPGSASDKTG